VPQLQQMLGLGFQVMQCHVTPDAQPLACVGFVRRCDTLGLTLAILGGVHDPDTIDTEHPPLVTLHTVASLIRKHGTLHPTGCAPSR
jgi:hypothetical protein